MLDGLTTIEVTARAMVTLIDGTSGNGGGDSG